MIRETARGTFSAVFQLAFAGIPDHLWFVIALMAGVAAAILWLSTPNRMQNVRHGPEAGVRDFGPHRQRGDRVELGVG